MKIIRSPSTFLCILICYGCSPQPNEGDLLIGGSLGSPILSKEKVGAFGLLSGQVEVGPGGIISRKRIRLLTIFVLTPVNEAWLYAGGGDKGQPWYYQLFYSASWISFPVMYFFDANSKRREFVFKFDGRKRTVGFAGKIYPISSGDFLFVKLYNDFEPKVWVGARSLKDIPMSVEISGSIMCHFKNQMLITMQLTKRCT